MSKWFQSGHRRTSDRCAVLRLLFTRGTAPGITQACSRGRVTSGAHFLPYTGRSPTFFDRARVLTRNTTRLLSGANAQCARGSPDTLVAVLASALSFSNAGRHATCRRRHQDGQARGQPAMRERANPLTRPPETSDLTNTAIHRRCLLAIARMAKMRNDYFRALPWLGNNQQASRPSSVLLRAKFTHRGARTHNHKVKGLALYRLS